MIHLREACNDTMSRTRRYAGYAGAMIGQSTIQRLANLLTNVVLARVLDVTGFGVYSVVATTAGSAFGLARMGSESALLVQTAALSSDAESRSSRGELLGAGLLILVLAGAVGLAGCLIFADRIAEGILGDRLLVVWIRVAGVAALLLCLSQFCSVALAGLEYFTSYAKVVAVMAVLQAAMATVCGVLFGLTGAVFALILIQALTVAAMALVLRRALRVERVRIAFRNLSFWTRRLLSFGLPFHAAALAWIPVSYYLQGVLARQAGVDALGYLRAIVSVTTLVTFVPASLATTVGVMLSSSPHTGRFATDAMRTIKLVALFGVVVAPLVILILPWLIPALFGATYKPITGAAGIALTASVLASLSQAVEVALLSAQRPTLVLGLTLVRGLAFLATGRFFITRYGVAGYVIADLAGHAALLAVAYWQSHQWLRQHIVAREWLSKVLVLWVLLLVFSLNQSQHDTRTVMDVVLGSAVVSAVCLWIYQAVLDRDERQALSRLFQMSTLRDGFSPAANK